VDLGYARVSTVKQDLDRQIHALQASPPKRASPTRSSRKSRLVNLYGRRQTSRIMKRRRKTTIAVA
jgi:predicted site-specific integrase-resolvase